MQSHTSLIGDQDLGLQRPVAFGFRHFGQVVEEGGTDPLTPAFFADIDADLSDSGRASGIGHGRQSCPAHHTAIFSPRCDAPKRHVPSIPVPPKRWG